ncbi:MAG: hypothetical protein WBG50_09895 [Desulfomonilaceae bacterium]
MELVSTVESLSHHVEGFAGQIDEIGSWMSAFNQEPKPRTIMTADLGMTKSACLSIIVNAQAVMSAIDLIDHAESIDLSEFMAKGGGMTALDWIPVLDDFKNAHCSVVEYRFRVVLDALRSAKERIREFGEDRLYSMVLSEKLGPQARLAFQHYLFFHREHMKDAFLMLQGLLVHGLDRRFAELPVLIYRMERLVSRVKSIVEVSSDGLSPDDPNGAALDISAWALPKQ